MCIVFIMEPYTIRTAQEILDILKCYKEKGAEFTCQFYRIKRRTINNWIKCQKETEQKLYKQEYKKAIYKEQKQLEKELCKIKPIIEKTVSTKPKKKYYSLQYNRRHIFKTIFSRLKRNDRAKEYPNELPTISQLWQLAKRQKCKCALSGIKLTNNNISIDHIHPLSKQGGNNIENLQLVEKRLNYMKYTMTKEELIDLCNLIIEYNTKPQPVVV